MAINKEAYQQILTTLQEKRVTLVAVSKTKPVSDIQELYDLGHRDFGENYVQELSEKAALLPADIRWHFIGHLQSNKVKYIAPFVHLVHGVDSFKLLEEINKQGAKNNRMIDCLLQVYIAKEETKFGLNEEELKEVLVQYNQANLLYTKVCGLMGMASFTDQPEVVRAEFRHLKNIYDTVSPLQFRTLSMGMSSDYTIAVAEGSNMVRVGSLLFGERTVAQ